MEEERCGGEAVIRSQFFDILPVEKYSVPSL